MKIITALWNEIEVYNKYKPFQRELEILGRWAFIITISIICGYFLGHLIVWGIVGNN